MLEPVQQHPPPPEVTNATDAEYVRQDIMRQHFSHQPGLFSSRREREACQKQRAVYVCEVRPTSHPS